MNALLLLALLVPSEPPPIKALLITGGCCHDYNVQKLIISEGTAARARIEWVIVQDGGTKTNSRIALHEKSDWAKGFDVVIHNECFADVKDPAWTENIVKPHREGTGAVLIHCVRCGASLSQGAPYFRQIPGSLDHTAGRTVSGGGNGRQLRAAGHRQKQGNKKGRGLRVDQPVRQGTRLWHHDRSLQQ